MSDKYDNSGRLFKNEYKKQDNHPDYRGDLMVDGVKKDISAWLSNTKDGKPYLSIKVQEPYEKNKKAGNDSKQFNPANAQKQDDGLPF